MPGAGDQAAHDKKGGGSKSTKSRGERRRRGKGQAAAQAAQETPSVGHPLLEELRKGSKPDLHEVTTTPETLPGFAQDQQGSAYVKEKLDGSKEDVQEIFDWLLPHVA